MSTPEADPSADREETVETADDAEAAVDAPIEESIEASASEMLEPEPLPNGLGPDPVYGAGVTLAGIFVMAVGGSRDLHWVFDVGVLIAVAGAGVFVLFVALSAMKMRRAEKEEAAAVPPPEAEADAS